MPTTIAECGECGHRWVVDGERPGHPTCSRCREQGDGAIEFSELLAEAEINERVERRAEEARKETEKRWRQKARRRSDSAYNQGYDQGYIDGYYACREGYPAPQGAGVPPWAQAGAGP